MKGYGIIIVFPKLEDGQKIARLLARNGLQVVAVCTNGSQALEHADDLGRGLVICGFRFADMLYTELLENLPSDFELILMASREVLEHKESDNAICVSMPLKVHELLETVRMVQNSLQEKRKKVRRQPAKRDPAEQELIDRAKKLLMVRNHMSEEEAHRYLQKRSMDSGNQMTETAEMIISLLDL